jgi:hypothetical protein
MIEWKDGSVAEFLSDHLPDDPFVFEWGPGASTIWLLKRGAFVVAVEHDEQWMNLREKLPGDNWFLHLRVYGGPSAHSLNDPLGYAGTFGQKRDFEGYVRLIEQYPPCFDLIHVDGRARPGCITAARKRVRPGGWILLHDSERDHYAPAKATMAGWKAIEGRDGPKEFTAWQRPL